jgi:hypothetical protein
MFHVKHSAKRPARERRAREIIFVFVFHVKRFVKVNKTISLTYTKFAEDHIQHILDIDPAEQPAEGPSRHP